jgi:hypothetical protein
MFFNCLSPPASSSNQKRMQNVCMRNVTSNYEQAFKNGNGFVPNFPIHSLEDGTKFHMHDLYSGFSLIVIDFYLSFGPRTTFPTVAYDA